MDATDCIIKSEHLGLMEEMSKAFSFFSCINAILCRNFKSLRRNISFSKTTSRRYQKCHSLLQRDDLGDHTLIFSVEGVLLKSSSFFTYFMLVAFEAGSIFRALLLLLSYPVVCLLGEETGLKMMVFVSFFGMKEDSFRAGRAVLPKFFLEDVGSEMFEVIKRGGKTVGVSDFPRVMIESFLRDYLEVDVVLGRELKVFRGFFVGLLEDEKKVFLPLETAKEQKTVIDCSNSIGINGHGRCFDPHLSSFCKEIYTVSKAEKKRWKILPRERYPNPLIFHDGRLAVKPTPMNSLALFMWLPLGLALAGIRAAVSVYLPYNICAPINAFFGMRLTVSKPITSDSVPKSLVYVCNHRTLLDPLYLSFILRKKPAAVTYSLSRMSEILSPIKTVRLTRNRDQDQKMMEKLLTEGDMIVCPEGTTCREPYLLRFSPLFSEMKADIVPVANDTRFSFFYGTTASGFKCLDPVFFLMDPSPTYTVRLLEKISASSTCGDGESRSRFDLANQVQRELAKALGFECTKLTRRDKYMVLAGNEGIAYKIK